MTDISLDWLVSVDDHVLEPPHVWQERLPAKFKEAGPHIVNDADGEAWVFEGKRKPTTGLSAAAGKKREDFSPLPITYADMRPGCYEPNARDPGHEPRRCACLAVVSVIPAVLWTGVHRGRGP